jgi:hypothetical protein
MPLINTAPTARKHSHHEHVLKSPAAQKPEKPEAPSRPSTAAVTETRETPDKTRAKGVLRLLGEDHFKGVAAVRLRMNFQAELEQKDAIAQTESARTAATQLQGGMAATLANTTDELDEALVGPLKAIFNQFDQVVSDSLADEAATSDIRAAAVDAIATLKKELVSLFDEGDTSTPSNPSVIDQTQDASVGTRGNPEVTDATTSAPAASSPLLSSLLDEIDQLTTAFENTASTATQLSGIEGIIAPSGNGVAFEKFVEQYRAQFGSAADQNDQQPLVDGHA